MDAEAFLPQVIRQNTFGILPVLRRKALADAIRPHLLRSVPKDAQTDALVLTLVDSKRKSAPPTRQLSRCAWPVAGMPCLPDDAASVAAALDNLYTNFPQDTCRKVLGSTVLTECAASADQLLRLYEGVNTASATCGFARERRIPSRSARKSPRHAS